MHTWIVNSHFSTLIIAREPLANFTRYKERALKKRITLRGFLLPRFDYTHRIPAEIYFIPFFYYSFRIFFRKVNVLIARFLWPFLACRLLGKVYGAKPYLCTLASIGNSRLSSNTLRALDSFRPEVLRFFSRLHATLRLHTFGARFSIMKTIVLSNVNHFYLKKKKKGNFPRAVFVDRKVSFRNFFKSSSFLSKLCNVYMHVYILKYFDFFNRGPRTIFLEL